MRYVCRLRGAFPSNAARVFPDIITVVEALRAQIYAFEKVEYEACLAYYK